MKKILSTIILACVALTVSAQTVSVPGQPAQVFSGKVAALSTSSWYTVSCESETEVALLLNYNYLNAPGAGDVNGIRLDFQRGIGTDQFETNVWTAPVIAAGSSTAAAATFTNVTVAGISQLRVRFANVSTNSHATNFTLHARAKRLRAR
jgi:hypothetical protein